MLPLRSVLLSDFDTITHMEQNMNAIWFSHYWTKGGRGERWDVVLGRASMTRKLWKYSSKLQTIHDY